MDIELHLSTPPSTHLLLLATTSQSFLLTMLRTTCKYVHKYKAFATKFIGFIRKMFTQSCHLCYVVLFFRRALILALFFVVTCARAQILPVSSAGDDNDCALYLTGPGRSSAFDYNLNLLRGSL